MKKTVFLGIGTNKGDREKNISLALNLLSHNKNIEILKVSKMLKNPPQEGIKSGYFLNGAIKLSTSLKPGELLKVCKQIERRLGRSYGSMGVSECRSIKKSRTIDLDVLFYENQIIDTEELTIPHPRLYLRYFVLIPLMEIGPEMIHPVLKKSVRELYSELKLKNQPSLKTGQALYKDLNKVLALVLAP